MKLLRSYLQTVTMLLMGILHLCLLTYFAVNFFDYNASQFPISILEPLAEFFTSPFQGAFSPLVTDSSTVDYSVFLAIFGYTWFFIILLRLEVIYLKTDSESKTLQIIDLLFGQYFVVLIADLILNIFNTGEAAFISLIENLSLITGLELILTDMEHKSVLATLISFAITIFVWIVAHIIAIKTLNFIKSTENEKPKPVKIVKEKKEKKQVKDEKEQLPVKTEIEEVIPVIRAEDSEESSGKIEEREQTYKQTEQDQSKSAQPGKATDVTVADEVEEKESVIDREKIKSLLKHAKNSFKRAFGKLFESDEEFSFDRDVEKNKDKDDIKSPLG